MIVENKMIGVITIQSFKYSAYQPYHLDILKTLASYIGTAIDNAHLYNTLENRVKERTVQLEQKIQILLRVLIMQNVCKWNFTF